MDPAPIRLLLVDDSLETCDILENYFGLTPEIEVCGVAHDGEEALFRIGQSQPDVVLLDLIMPKLDGLAVLDRLAHAPLTKRPKIIVTSAVGQESFTSAAIAMGADYYMIKPCDLADLYARVRTAAALGREKSGQPPAAPPAVPPASTAPPAAPAPSSTRTTSDAEAQISRLLLELGIPAQLLGYRYCMDGVSILLHEDRPQSIVKDVYARVATKYETTPECVEGAIRKVIRRAWETEGRAIRALTGGSEESWPTNGRFLTSLAQHLRLGGERGGGIG